VEVVLVRSTMMEFPLTVTSILRAGTSGYGDKQVVTATADGTRSRSYAQVGERVARLANALRSLGIDGDQRVGTFMWNNAEHLEAYLAIPCMGAVLHTLNLRLTPEQIGYIATHAGDHTVICDASLAPLFARVLPHAPAVKQIIVVGPTDVEFPGVTAYSYEDLLAAASDEFEWPVLDELSAAAMCYSSGTTGGPKGVVYSHRSTYLHSLGPCLGNAFAFCERDRVLPVVPMFHANAWGFPYAALFSGADLVMPDRFMQPEAISGLIEAERVTVAGGVPTVWTGVLEHIRAHGGDISTMRVCVCGGSAVPHSLMTAFEDELGVRLMQAWGMTETSPLGSIADAPAGVMGDEQWQYRDSQGRLFSTLEGRIAGDGGVILPCDGKTVGELEVRGPWVTGSYYKDEDPAKFHDGWLRTGDVGTLDPLGYIRLTDRAKDVIKSGGEWISSMELENLLMAHPSVIEAGVVGVPDEKWGERPLAAVVVREGESVTVQELREFLTGKVARWQVPERWTFVAQIPRTSVGKFSKIQMREAYARGDYEVILTR
jgi:fatty-acyl-CoA synthase